MNATPTSFLPFLNGGGEMGERMRSFDWSATPLGSPETWPQSLCSCLSVVLNSTLLGTVLWGPDMLMLYNDAYIPALGERHPGALGRPVADVWGETFAPIAEAFNQTMTTGVAFGQPFTPATKDHIRVGRQPARSAIRER